MNAILITAISAAIDTAIRAAFETGIPKTREEIQRDLLDSFNAAQAASDELAAAAHDALAEGNPPSELE